VSGSTSPQSSEQPSSSSASVSVSPESEQHRAAFLRSQGWSESLPEEQRLSLEATFTPEKIDYSHALAF